MYKITRYTGEIKIKDFLDKYYNPEVTLERCRQCSGYAKTWSCPEFEFNTKEYWENYSTFKIVVDKISLEGTETQPEAEERLHAEKARFNEEMLRLENQIPESKALYAQECEECSKCARLEGKPCRLPGRMRYAVESLGGSAVRLVKDQFGFDIKWSTGKDDVPEYYLCVGGLLLK